MKTQTERAWSELSEDELNGILTSSSNRKLRSAAKKELSRRIKGSFVRVRSSEEWSAERVELVALDLTCGNFLWIFVTALPALILTVVTARFIVLLMNLLLLNFFVQGVEEEFQKWEGSYSQLQNTLKYK